MNIQFARVIADCCAPIEQAIRNEDSTRSYVVRRSILPYSALALLFCTRIAGDRTGHHNVKIILIPGHRSVFDQRRRLDRGLFDAGLHAHTETRLAERIRRVGYGQV